MTKENVNEQNTIGLFPGFDQDRVMKTLGKVLLRHCWLLILLALLGAGMGFAAAKLTYVPSYEANATLAVTATSDPWGSLSSYDDLASKQMAETFDMVVNTNVFRRMLQNSLGTSTINGTIEVSAASGTNLLTIVVRSSQASDAHAILEAVLENYPAMAERMLGSVRLEIFDQTGLPARPRNPFSARRSLLVGAALGALLGAFILFLYAVSRRTVVDKADIRRISNVEYLGSLPRARFKKRRKAFDESILFTNPRISRDFTEAAKSVWVRLRRRLDSHRTRVLLVTSAVPGEGKSTVAANVAALVSQDDKRVILVDMDFRHPSAHKTLGVAVEKGKGTVDVLMQRCSVRDALISVPGQHFKLLPGGDAEYDPLRLANFDKRVGGLIGQLRPAADLIVIDAPPGSVMADPMILAQHCDNCLFVIRQDYARQNVILNCMEQMENTPARLLGCVINLAARRSHQGENHYYGSRK